MQKSSKQCKLFSYFTLLTALLSSPTPIQNSHCFFDILFIHICISQKNRCPLICIFPDPVIRKSIYTDILFFCPFDQLIFVPSLFECQQDMYSRMLSLYRTDICQRLQCIDQNIVPVFIQSSCLIQMTFVISIFDKMLYDHLIYL